MSVEAALIDKGGERKTAGARFVTPGRDLLAPQECAELQRRDAWCARLALPATAASYEPKRMRLRILATAGRPGVLGRPDPVLDAGVAAIDLGDLPGRRKARLDEPLLGRVDEPPELEDGHVTLYRDRRSLSRKNVVRLLMARRPIHRGRRPAR